MFTKRSEWAGIKEDTRVLSRTGQDSSPGVATVHRRLPSPIASCYNTGPISVWRGVAHVSCSG